MGLKRVQWEIELHITYTFSAKRDQISVRTLKEKEKEKKQKKERNQKEKEKGDQLNVPAKSDTVEMQNSLSLTKETKSSTSPKRFGWEE